MSMDVRVVGVGMIPFAKPSASESYVEMGAKAVAAALADAGLSYAAIQQAYAGYVYGDSTCGQAVLYRAGLTGIPIFNVNNNCSTGSSALFLARQAVASGQVECALAVGFEEMRPGALGSNFPDRVGPMARHAGLMGELQPHDPKAPRAAVLRRRRRGVRGKIWHRSGSLRQDRRQGARACRQQSFRDLPQPAVGRGNSGLTAAIRADDPLSMLPANMRRRGAIVCSPAFAARHGLDGSVAIKAQAMTSDTASTFEERSMIKLIGYDMAKDAASAVYESAGVGPEDIQVVELHDCFTANELLTYEALGLTAEGTAEQFITDGANTYGGKVVTNPSGGLLSKGHPLAPPALRNAPNWSGNCAAQPVPARCAM